MSKTVQYQKGQAIIIKKNSLKTKANDKIKMQNGFICGIVLWVKPAEDVSFAVIRNQVCQDINDLHHKLRHALKSIVWQTTKFFNWMITNQFENCVSCALAKLRQKNTNKEKKPWCNEASGIWLFMDISLVQEKSFGRCHYWLLAIDDVMDFCFSNKLMKSKDQTPTIMVSLLQDLKSEENIVIEKIHCDNAGEDIMISCFSRKQRRKGWVSILNL